MSESDAPLFELPDLERTEPIRNAGGVFRTTAREANPGGGVPLNTLEDTVVNTLRMAYRVADGAIDRSLRLARRLGDASERAGGPESGSHAADAAEKLVFRALMASLAWLERVASQDATPLMRLAAAAYHLWASLVGLNPRPMHPPSSPKGASPQPQCGQRAGAPPHAAAAPATPVRELSIVHEGEQRLFVKVIAYELGPGTPDEIVMFYNLADRTAAPLKGRLGTGGAGSAKLTLSTTWETALGTWRAPICDADGVQIGCIDITL